MVIKNNKCGGFSNLFGENTRKSCYNSDDKGDQVLLSESPISI